MVHCYMLTLSSKPKIWRFHARCFLEYGKEVHGNSCCTCSTIIFTFITNNILVLRRCRCRSRRLCLNYINLLNLILRQRYRHRKINQNIPRCKQTQAMRGVLRIHDGYQSSEQNQCTEINLYLDGIWLLR